MTTAVVELVGLPGSGKTTLAEALQRRLRSGGMPCTIVDAGVSARARKEVRVLRRAGHALRELAAAPGATRRSVDVLRRSGQDSYRDTAAVLAQWLATERLLTRARDGSGVQLLEEGLVQTAWTALLRSRRLRAEGLWACVPAAARPDLVLFVDVRPDLAAERLAARASRHSRLQRVAPSVLVGELRRGQAILDELVLGCPWPVARVPSSGASVETVAAAAEDVIVGLIGPAPAEPVARSSDLR